MIQTTGLTRKFGDFAAVNDLNLHVSKGVIFGLLGPNGSDKSTTVKMLTGILKPARRNPPFAVVSFTADPFAAIFIASLYEIFATCRS